MTTRQTGKERTCAEKPRAGFGLALKGLAAFSAVVVQMAACAAETIPGTDIQYDHDLTKSDSSSYSLTTGYATQKWSDGYTIQAGDENVVLYIPAGLTAYATSETQTIVPKIYCAGRINNAGTASLVFTFNNLFLLEGGEIIQSRIGRKAGRITILSEDAEHPALLTYSRSGAEDFAWRYSTLLRACVVGSKDSQFLYRMGGLYPGMLKLETGSDWSGFEGTLRIADGLGIESAANVPVTMPGAVRFGRDGILLLSGSGAPYSFGELSFAEGGSITNTGSGATLTVAGTFDTGTNCYWLSKNPGTFGTLILGDGLTLRDEQPAPTTVFNVTNRLEVGENITIEYPCVSAPSAPWTEPLPKVLLMKLSPEAVAAGVPEFSGVAVSFSNEWTWVLGRLTTETDPDVSGGLLVYATINSSNIITYIGPDEWDSSSDRGKWLDPELAAANWSDGLYPNDPTKIYCVTTGVFTTSSSSTFPGKTLCGGRWIYMTGSVHIDDYRCLGSGLYVRSDNLHFTGNFTPCGGTRNVRILRNDRKFYLDAALHGSFGMEIECYQPTSESGCADIHLTADNSDWTGTLKTEWTPGSPSGSEPLAASEDRHVRLVVGDAKALGGDQASFTWNKIALVDYGEIRFTNSTVMAQANRGIGMIDAFLRVDEGQTVTLMAPVSLYGGTLYKAGTGTLLFGGGIVWKKTVAKGSNIRVQEGAIKVASLDKGAVTFADNTGIVADESIGVMDLTGATVTAEGSIYLKADANTVPEPTEEVVYPVVKVSAEQDATLGPAFRAARAWKGWAATLVSDTDGDGNVTYSVKYEKKGTVIVIQ